jgi:hypothetical protein
VGAIEFGRLVDRAIHEHGMSQARLAVLVGELPDGKVLNETQVRRIREGGRRLDHVLVSRLIASLNLDPNEAWPAAGLAPPQLTPEHLRQLELFTRRPTEPALTRVGGSDTPPAPSLRPVRRAPVTTQGRRDNSCYGRSYRIHAGQRRRRLLEPAHIGQRVAA